MLQKIPSDVCEIYNTFLIHNFQIYFVGGSVRNMLLDVEVKDWDLTTNATPEEILKLFPDAFYDNAYGTVGIPLPTPASSPEDEGKANKHILELTTFRTEHGYSDRRRPNSVSWGKTIEEDLSRRDFTVNAIALKLTIDISQLTTDMLNDESSDRSSKQLADNYILIDPYNGQEDIQNKIIRAVGNPNERFKEDALRLLRAVRFATQLGFSIEEKTLTAITEDALLLEHIAGERIREEVLKILASPYPYDGIMLLKNTDLLQIILPELMEGIDVSQVRPGRHHTSDVFTHNVEAMKFAPTKNPIVKFATLLHDVGKPRVRGVDEQGFVTFYNHEVVGARIARDISDRFRFSKKDKEKITKLIRWHMFSIEDIISDAAIRRFIRRIGIENIKDMLAVRTGDRLGSGAKEDSWRFEKFRERVEQELLPPPFSITDLAINGTDVMKELNIKPSRKVGEILKKLFEEVDEDMQKNTKEYLLKRIHEIK